MKKLTQLMAIICAIALLFSLTACGDGTKSPSTPNEDDGKLVIGYAQKTTEDAWRITETEDMKAEAAKRGIKLIVTDARSNTEKQIADCEDLIAQNVDLLLISPVEGDGYQAVYKAAREAGIPVFLICDKTTGEVGVDFVTMITADCVFEGELAGQFVLDTFGDACKVVELTGIVGDIGSGQRSEGFMNTVSTKGGIEVISSQPADWSRSKAQDVMTNIIHATGGEFDVVYCHNSEMALGAVAALKAAGIPVDGSGKEGVVVIGIDAQKEAVQAVIDGDMGAVVSCNPYMGEIVFDAVEAYLAGEKIETELPTADYLIDSSNAVAELEKAF